MSRLAYRPLVQQEGLWLPEGAVEEMHARQVRAAMEDFGESDRISGPFDRLERFAIFGRYQFQWWAKTRTDWLRRAGDGTAS